jgi:hypothetical protein
MPMRTSIILAALVVAALAAAAGPNPTHAQTQSATITIDRGHASVPAGVDALLSSTYTLHNTGDTVIRDAQLAFQPSNAGDVPDGYFFFREWLDGAEQPSPGVTTIFDAGDIAPGAAREIRFQIIVHSAHPFAADAVLLGAPNQHEFVRQTVRVAADEPQPAQIAAFRIVPTNIGAGTGVVQYRLLITNDSDDALRNVVVDVAGAKSAPLTSIGAPAQLERTDPTPNSPISANVRDIAPHEQFETLLSFESRSRCDYTYPAALVRARLYRGTEPHENIALPAVADAGFSFNCMDGSDSGLGLPVAGAGPDPDGRARAWSVVLLLVGAAILETGWTLRRRRRA